MDKWKVPQDLVSAAADLLARHGKAIGETGQAWEQHAWCAQIESGTNARVFHPERPDGSEAECSVVRRMRRAARATCSRCQVAPYCLAGALARAEQHGIWAGTTPRQRLLIADDISARPGLEWL